MLEFVEMAAGLTQRSRDIGYDARLVTYTPPVDCLITHYY